MASQLPSFDQLMDLAQNDPEALETLRQELSDEIIQQAPEPARLKLQGINFKVSMERQRCKNPLQTCIRLTSLMHDSFDQMREKLDALLHEPAFPEEHLPPALQTNTEPDKDNVVPFIRRCPQR